MYGNSIQYLVLWKGWPKEAAQWLDAENTKDRFAGI